MSMDSGISGMKAVARMAQTLALVDIPVDIRPTGKVVPWDIFGSEPYELQIGTFTKPDGTKMVLEEHYISTSSDDGWYTMCIGVAAYAKGGRPELPGDGKTITKEEFEARQQAEEQYYAEMLASLSPEERAEMDEREAERERQFAAFGSYYSDRKTVVAPDGTILDQRWLDNARNYSDEEFRFRMAEEEELGGKQELHLAAKMIGRSV